MYLSVDKIFMACIFYQDFLNRRLLLSRQLHSLRLLMVKLKYSLRKFYGRRHYFVRNVSVTGDHGYVTFVVVYTRDFHLYDLSSDFKITGVTSGACVVYISGIPTFTTDLSRVCVTQSLDFCVLFYGQLLVFSSFFSFWHLNCLRFELRLLLCANFPIPRRSVLLTRILLLILSNDMHNTMDG